MVTRKQKQAAHEAAKKGAAHHEYVMASHAQVQAEEASKSHGFKWTLQLLVVIVVVAVVFSGIGLWLGRHNRTTAPAVNDPLTDTRFQPSSQTPTTDTTTPAAPNNAATTPESSSTNTVQVPQTTSR